MSKVLMPTMIYARLSISFGDNGKVVTTIPEVMEKLNPLFYWDRSNDNCTYRQKPICYIMDNKILSSTEVNMMLLTEIDGLASIIISKGTGGVDDELSRIPKCLIPMM
ncbi:Uncharacterised protein [Bacteroides thetaiotaomicron]|nr:Uncharacterised protein [Bacteroides thetaiotaomicron]